MRTVKRWVERAPWKRIGIGSLIGAPILMIVAQFIYPFNQAMLYAETNGVVVGGMSREEAANAVDMAYQELPLDVYFGEAGEPYRTPSLRELDAHVETDSAVDSVMYPWWLRLVPTSLWWGHYTVKDTPGKVELSPDAVEGYATEELGESCEVAPKNATIKADGADLKVQPAEFGGTCELDDVTQAILKVDIALNDQNSVRIPLTRIDPDVSDADAEELISLLSKRLSSDVDLTYGNMSVSIDAKTVTSWIGFAVKDKKITAAIDSKKASKVLTEKLQSRVAKTPGVVTITTKDFQEVSRSGGGTGRTLNVDGTAQNLTKYLLGEADHATVAVTTLQPREKYIRSYSSTDTGLSALIQHYAEDQKGVYGVSLIELSGKQRRAGYNGQKNFFPASTYKVFVAYSVLRQVEAGKMKWSDQVVGGRDLAKCFDDMIVLSDNACPEALTLKIGVTTLNADIAEIGLRNTRFVGPEKHQTTAEDLSVFMANLERGHLSINSSSRSRLLGVLRQNIFRQGIPAGVSGSVANKVGFYNGLLHDTAIVYAKGGTYVLSIMTDKSSWANIAELTREIEKIRTK